MRASVVRASYPLSLIIPVGSETLPLQWAFLKFYILSNVVTLHQLTAKKDVFYYIMTLTEYFNQSPIISDRKLRKHDFSQIKNAMPFACDGDVRNCDYYCNRRKNELNSRNRIKGNWMLGFNRLKSSKSQFARNIAFRKESTKYRLK
jgi:hypothetical protein